MMQEHDIFSAAPLLKKILADTPWLRYALPTAAALAGTPTCVAMGVFDPHGPVASAEGQILIDATAIMLVVAIPVILMTLGFAWWFRASNRRASYNPEWTHSGQVELVVWAIPTMVVLLLAGVEWIGSFDLDPAKKLTASAAPIRIEAVSMDWKWLFIYPDHNVAAVNQIVVPTGAPLEFELTSASVMNAFFVPQLGSQIYTMPGMTTHLNLLADRRGDYPGFSSHFSGDGFSDMQFTVHAVSPAEFERWIREHQGQADALDSPAYDQLLQPGTSAKKIFGSVAPRTFERILAAAAPAGPLGAGAQ